MSAATRRPKRRQPATRNAVAIARPWVKPQEGTTKTRKVLSNGDIEITRVTVDRHGVIRRRKTVVVPT